MDVLFGAVNPAGKLVYTIANSLRTTPLPSSTVLQALILMYVNSLHSPPSPLPSPLSPLPSPLSPLPLPSPLSLSPLPSPSLFIFFRQLIYFISDQLHRATAHRLPVVRPEGDSSPVRVRIRTVLHDVYVLQSPVYTRHVISERMCHPSDPRG